MHAQVEDHARSLEQQLAELQQQEQSLDAKIEKRKQQLEWSEKRLSTMQSVRPAYMDEYEQLQGELQGLYQQYLDRYRGLEYLESELEQFNTAEQDALDASDRRLKKMQKRLAYALPHTDLFGTMWPAAWDMGTVPARVACTGPCSAHQCTAHRLYLLYVAAP
jgi:chromosome segregation ATPase